MGQDISDPINLSLQSDNQPDIGSMDIQSTNRSDPLSAIWNTMQDIVKWPIEFFTLTEEDKLKAGISLGGKERDK
jgi:hypothetical protein